MDIQKIEDNMRRLIVAALALNKASDELAKSIEVIDAAIGKLGLGVQCYHEVAPGLRIGYSRIGRKWGLVIADTDTEWLYNDAPRVLRVKMVDHILPLLESLNVAVIAAQERVIAAIQTAAQVQNGLWMEPSKD